MPLRLEIRRGPLASSDLERIATTYGESDPRYRSVDFCAKVFNRNPAGPALHGFLQDAGQTVGHYAVLPIWLQDRGRSVSSGKGEALFVTANRRSQRLAVDGTEMPAAMALMRAVHDRALADGAAVLHNVTTPEIGLLQRMEGFRAISLERDLRHVVLDWSAFPRLRASGTLRFKGRAVQAAQRLLDQAVGAATARSRRRILVNPPDSLPEILEETAGRFVDLPGWTVRRDPEFLGWQVDLGHLECCVSEGNSADRLLVTTGRSREIVDWKMGSGSLSVALALFGAAQRRARASGAALISVETARAARAGPAVLGAARLLGLAPFPFPVQLYVKSADPHYFEAANLAFDRLFHL